MLHQHNNGALENLSHNFNVRMLLTAHFTKFDELVKVQVMTKKVLTSAFGKENVQVTKLFKNEEYQNFGLYIYINVPREQQTMTSERMATQADDGQCQL